MVDHLYSRRYNGYENGDGRPREIDRQSIASHTDWIVGLPKDIEIKDRRGRSFILNLVSMVTPVDPMWLADVAPQLVQYKYGLNPYFNDDEDSCFSTTQIHFNGQVIKEEKVETPEHEKAADVFVSWLAGKIKL